MRLNDLVAYLTTLQSSLGDAEVLLTVPDMNGYLPKTHPVQRVDHLADFNSAVQSATPVVADGTNYTATVTLVGVAP